MNVHAWRIIIWPSIFSYTGRTIDHNDLGAHAQARYTCRILYSVCVVIMKCKQEFLYRHLVTFSRIAICGFARFFSLAGRFKEVCCAYNYCMFYCYCFVWECHDYEDAWMASKPQVERLFFASIYKSSETSAYSKLCWYFPEDQKKRYPL